ncbi:MAG: glsA [Chthonomonadaceae bacterium]|nr:glsA [Chthonomonadaceae bacterium]
MISPVIEYLEKLHAKFAALQGGEVATYIPELARADKRHFGICLATIDGQVYEVGDTRQPFTIQSISKPFVYATVLADHGADAVFRKVGVEPSGDAFNAISLDPQTGRPANPMINAGAIASTALLSGDTPAAKLHYMMEAFSRYAGHSLTIDEAVYISERDTGFRNHAIAFLLRNFGILEEDPIAVVDLYFRQCAILVDCRDLAVMAATLAGGGKNPLTGTRALDEAQVASVLSVMGSTGMYDYAGEWTFSVGLPSKSGVSGGIMAVLPGYLGIGVFSPPLDSRGNSLRGIEVCKELSQYFGLHMFHVPRTSRTVIHRVYNGQEVSSKRERSLEVTELLAGLADRIRIYELQGDLAFGTVEVVMHDILTHTPALDFIILDWERVTGLNGIAADLLSSLAIRLAENGKQLLLSHIKPCDLSAIQARIDRQCDDPGQLCLQAFPDIDRALEQGENSLLSPLLTQGSSTASDGSAVPLRDFVLLQGLNPTEIEALHLILQSQTYQAGEVIVAEGDRDDTVFLLVSGEASVAVRQKSGQEKRLATFSAGMSFGEMALLETSLRSATVSADIAVECLIMHKSDLIRLWAEIPRIRMVLMENLAVDLSRKLRRTNSLIGALGQ